MFGAVIEKSNMSHFKRNNSIEDFTRRKKLLGDAKSPEEPTAANSAEGNGSLPNLENLEILLQDQQ